MSPRSLNRLTVLFAITDKAGYGFREIIDAGLKLINDRTQIVVRLLGRIFRNYRRNVFGNGSGLFGLWNNVVVFHYFIPFTEYFLRPIKNHHAAIGARTAATKNCLSELSIC
jgi:hypothetical protein